MESFLRDALKSSNPRAMIRALLPGDGRVARAGNIRAADQKGLDDSICLANRANREPVWFTRQPMQCTCLRAGTALLILIAKQGSAKRSSIFLRFAKQIES